MLYKIDFTSKATGHRADPQFGDFERVKRLAAMNEGSFECEFSPAHHDDIQREWDRLTEARKSTQLSYENSPWDSGARWRAALEEVDRALDAIRPYYEPVTVSGPIPTRSDTPRRPASSPVRGATQEESSNE